MKGFLYFNETVKNLTHLSSWSHFPFCLPGNHFGMGETECSWSHDISVKCQHFSLLNGDVLPHLKSHRGLFFSSLEIGIAEKIKHSDLYKLPTRLSLIPIQKWGKTCRSYQRPFLLDTAWLEESISVPPAMFSSSTEGRDTSRSRAVSS